MPLRSFQSTNLSDSDVTITGGTAPRTLAARFSDVLNIMDFGAKNDGVTDDTAAVERALIEAPDRVYGWSSIVNRPQNAVAIYFPTGKGAGAGYRFTRKVTISGSKNVCFIGDSSHSARLFMDNPLENYIFRLQAGDGQRPTIFEKLIFHKGGIEYESGARRFHAIRDCVFQNCPEWGVRTLGISVIDFEISRCQFTENVGGLNVAFEQSDIWVVRHCSFIRNSGIDMKIQTSGLHAYDCDYEVKPTGSFDQPFVQIVNDSNGVRPGNDVVFENCRFGNEAMPPRDCVVLGPVNSLSAGTLGTIWFRGCLWRGANGQTPSSTSGKNAILINQQATNIHVVDSSFWSYENIIDEAYAVSPSGTNTAGNNVFRDNDVGAITGKVFTKGGIGWDVQYMSMRGHDRGSAQVGESSLYRPGRNLLPRTDNIPNSSWVASNALINKDVTGPDGLANSAWRIARSGSGASSSVRAATTSQDLISGSVCFSTWLKSSTTTRARISILDGANVFLAGDRDVLLTPDWRRFDVTAHGLNNQQATCRIDVGSATDTAAGEEICFAAMAAHKGTVPLAQLDNLLDASTTGSMREPIQWQGQVLGHARIGYGSAAPTAGQFNVGDLVYNTAPAAGGFVGWACVSGGLPGTWKTFGAISS